MDLEALKSFRLAPVEQRYTEKDTILYALGLGFGERATDPRHLQFVYEKHLKAVPSQCVVLAHPGFWVNDPALRIDWLKMLHGEQSFEIVRPLPPAGHVRAEYRIVAVEDKGVERGAVMCVEKRLLETRSAEPLAVSRSVYMLRGDGGQGGFGQAATAPEPLPELEADLVLDLPTLPQAALIYRLSGDVNPIHADPSAAQRAGFQRPILHGLCSLGMATRALIESLAEGDPERLRAVSVRFSKPVYPGETIRMEMFRTATGARFRARALERDVLVLDRGTATLT